MKRFVVSPVIGSGTFADPFRAAASDVGGANVSSIIPTGSDGHPLYHFCLCVAASGTFPQILSVSNLYAFPDYHLDGRMDGMEATARMGLDQSLPAYDLDGAGRHLDTSFYGDSSSYRDVINGIGQQFDTAFNVDHLDVTEPGS